MLTYDDFLSSESVEEFIEAAVLEHQVSKLYRDAILADRYYHLENPTILRYQKLLQTMAGYAIPDSWSPNNKVPSNWYYYFTQQAVGHLLANGVFFDDMSVKARLGDDFDRRLTQLAVEAKNGGVAFGFWNYDHLEVFTVREFVPLFDAFSGKLCAGIRFWQRTEKLRFYTLYEADGYTQFRKEDGDAAPVCVGGKQPYIRTAEVTQDGRCRVEVGGRNYGVFPIVPLWNTLRQSDIAGNRHVLDAYDLMASGLVNNVDEGNFIYWILKNCDGMDDEDDARFIEQLRRFHFAHANGDEGAGVESHVVETPFAAHGAALDRLERQLFANFMAVDVRSIRGSSVTATEIRAAYEPLNTKTDMFEYELIEFIGGILACLGLRAVPLFKRSQVVNQLEETQMVLAAAEFLDVETILRKLPWVTVDEVEEILARNRREVGTNGSDETQKCGERC